MLKIFLTRFRIKMTVLLAAVTVMAVVAVGILGPTLAQAAVAQLFRWESVEIVCSGNYAGTSIPFSGSYRIPTMNSGQQRACMLRIVWKLNGRVPDWRAEALYQRAIRGNGVLLIDGRRTTFGVRRHAGDRRRFAADIPARSLPTLPAQIGIEILEENGTQVVASPTYRRFVSGDPLVAEEPRILSVQINGGARTIDNPRLRLDLTTAGGQVTHYMVTENVTGGPADFLRSRWQSYPPTTGAARPVTYTLQNTEAGQKAIAIKVKSGTLESDPIIARFDFLWLVDYTIKGPPSVLAFSEQNGFRHQAIARGRSQCVLGTADGVADVNGPGECDFILFEGRRLNPGWQFLSLTIGRDRFLRVSNLRLGVNDQPRTTFRLVRERDPGFEPGTPPVPALRGGLITVKLRGPAGADWRDAFRR